ncbi:DENN domain-containing protein 1A isoform X1 [Microcaecilia unicolor]|uniref:DENN domain-containing protein 1A isoform X1 n=1 Tax=Microcaecilia unicolor TaxID=1415580 RepID=A0A6P7YE44_9AMPH|nr:DENN domain-containing protein 1A isoform X1 [Microcaecilia unicolor]
MTNMSYCPAKLRQNPETTFEVYVEVTYQGSSGTGTDPEVRRQFPEDYHDQEVLQTLTKFCFPFYVDSLAASQVGQNFTFVLTDIDSKQRFGFCRLSSGAKNCFCILSYLPWFEVFYKLLNILADYTAKGQNSQWTEFLETLYKLSIPDPGVPVHLSVHSYFTVPDIRELPSIPENRNLTEYFVAVDVNNMLHLYASMLYERRILIFCSKLSTLTACIHGSAAMLYPMYWQHVYIPVLPPHLLDYCGAPMPFLIGVHASLMEKVKTMNLDDVVILNVDTNTLETPFDDLQNLPNDVVSSLKNRLKKVSSSTGDGVARAFLKAQASLFGSYRSALKIEPEEPITFCEETFISHRSSAMRQFLQNAIQLQLFKQFIDERLDLLNSGNGFSDIFEDEINMGEYAGSDKLYHQWLSTVRKGSGAILNTVKTKANPAMKTVYKFAKDHAKMGIKEVKNRLKQKDITENGCSAVPDEPPPRTAPSPLVEKKEPKLRDDRRPITVHFGQQEKIPPRRPPPPKIQRSTMPVRPPRPHVVKRPKSNTTVESRRTSVSSPEHSVKPTRHYTVFLSEDSSDDEFQHEEDPVSGFSENFLFSAPFEWPQPYRALKESDADGDETISPEKNINDDGLPNPPTSDRFREICLLEDIFSHLEVETPTQPLTQAKSLEDLRTPKEEDGKECTFDYQRMDFRVPERNRIMPPMKHPHPYNKLWSMGQDDMAIPTKYSQSSPERPLAFRISSSSSPQRPHCKESIVTSSEKEETSTQSNITIPRPQSRKTPELGIVPPPPTLRPGKHQALHGTAADHLKTQTVASNDLASELMHESFGIGNTSLEPESSEPLNYSSNPAQLLSDSSGTADMLQPVKVLTENAGSDDLLSLLDPLSSCQSTTQPPGSSSLHNSATSLHSSPAIFPSLANDFASSTAVLGQQVGYPSAGPQFLQPSLNPFTHAVPTALPMVRPPFATPVGPSFSASLITSGSCFYQPPRPRQNLSVLPLTGLFGQVPTGSQVSPLMQSNHNLSQTSCMQSRNINATPNFRTLEPPQSGVNLSDSKKRMAVKSSERPAIPPRPSQVLEPLLLPSNAEEPKDPFEDLLCKTKQDIAPEQGKVEQLRKRWETFE